MDETTVHNPDIYMSDLRHILSQGRKRIGLLIGAGAPFSVCVDDKGNLDDDGNPLIPDGIEIMDSVIDSLEKNNRSAVDAIFSELEGGANIEKILTKIRLRSQAIGDTKIHGLNGEEYGNLAEQICDKIGERVAQELPKGPNPFTKLASWIGGTHRKHPVEIFTPNYDLLIEEAFEREQLPFFDGFSGSHKPFFDPASIFNDPLPPRWSRVWKIHGSLGWKIEQGTVVRTGDRKARNLIYPDHMKYDQITRQPYSALFERLRTFLMTPDSLLLCSGFSFSDAHITAVLDEALAANASTAILAFQYKSLDKEFLAVDLARRRPNMSVYAPDEAVIFGTQGKWQPGKLLTEEWENIRRTFWNSEGKKGEKFLLGDFAALVHFFSLAQSSDLKSFSHQGAPSLVQEVTLAGSNAVEVTHQETPDSVQEVTGEDDA